MLSYEFHPLAERELDEAVGFYEDILPGKGWNLPGKCGLQFCGPANFRRLLLWFAAPFGLSWFSRTAGGAIQFIIASSHHIAEFWLWLIKRASHSIGLVVGSGGSLCQPSEALQLTAFPTVAGEVPPVNGQNN